MPDSPHPRALSVTEPSGAGVRFARGMRAGNWLFVSGLLPDDVSTSDSTGYSYVINLIGDKKQYFATATPAVYGKSGKLSFLLKLDGKGISHVTSKDNGGKMMNK